MGFFDHLQKGGSFSLQAQKPQIRKVVQARATPSRSSSLHVPTRTPSRNSPLSENGRKTLAQKNRSVSTGAEARFLKGRSDAPSRNRKRHTPEQRLSSDDDDDADDTDTSFDVRKRARLSDSTEIDPERHVRSLEAFSEGVPEFLPRVHAAEIASLKQTGKYRRAFGQTDKSAEIFLQYPSASRKERYNLVLPRDDDDFKPIDEIVQVIETVSQNHIPEEDADEFSNESTGINRRLRRALAHVSETQFRQVVADYNHAIERIRVNGGISKRLDATKRLPLSLVERILNQIYSRTVSPRVDALRQYENGTDNVYGELLPRFISTIFKETGLKSGQVFVDLGSGVGNVVLQAALEIGCESWGCEVMQNASELAQLQQAEFQTRCRLWGIQPGKTHLIRGDFLTEESIIRVLKRADVVLINNQAFTPQLNNELINHFLDMKEGCQIVSLKSFVPAGHKIQSRNLNSPINLLTVKQKNYWSNSVSWTDVGGTYFIATKDSSKLKAFVENME